jgi:trehalose 6-phosphate phosphatase
VTSPRLPPQRDRAWALFLDVDGTLLDIVESPDAVHVPADLKQTLAAVAAAEDGALALVSGRSLAQLDALFAPFRFAAAGLHGLERRDAVGRVLRPAVPAAQLTVARRTLGEFVALHPALLLEDKGAAIALHYRRAPDLEGEARRIMTALEASLGPHMHVQEGKCVLELKPRGANKRTAIEAFMSEAPFASRMPVFAGDDVTDEDGFAAVNALGGISIRVGDGPATRARYRIASVDELRAWLAGTLTEEVHP